MKHALPGINHIYYVNCLHLPADITLRALANIPVGVYTTLNHIGKIGDASCEMEAQFDNNSQVEKASLTFYSLDELPTDEHLAFVITTVQGEAYIIGTKELPYPIIKVTRSTGIPDGEPFVRKYEISFTAKKIPQIQV